MMYLRICCGGIFRVNSSIFYGRGQRKGVRMRDLIFVLCVLLKMHAQNVFNDEEK